MPPFAGFKIPHMGRCGILHPTRLKFSILLDAALNPKPPAQSPTQVDLYATQGVEVTGWQVAQPPHQYQGHSSKLVPISVSY